MLTENKNGNGNAKPSFRYGNIKETETTIYTNAIILFFIWIQKRRTNGKILFHFIGLQSPCFLFLFFFLSEDLGRSKNVQDLLRQR